MKAPTYSYQVGSYNIGRDGTLTGEENLELIAALAEKDFKQPNISAPPGRGFAVPRKKEMF